jgi:xanthine dehydrogenase accessory factor
MQEDIFELVVDARRRGLPTALATVVGAKGSTPAKLGARMLVHFDGRIAGTIGGGCVEADVIRSSRDVMDTGLARVLQFRLAGAEAERTGIACGGILDVMIESLEDPRTLIVGAGHVGQTTARLASQVGLKVTVIDDRPDFANKERFPTADTISICDLDQLPTDQNLTVRTSILIMTLSKLIVALMEQRPIYQY